jgi:hypothetical protein
MQKSLEEVVGLAERLLACLSHARPYRDSLSKLSLFRKWRLEQQELFELALRDHLLHRLGRSTLHQGFSDEHQSVEKQWINVRVGSDRVDLLIKGYPAVSEHNISDGRNASGDASHQERVWLHYGPNSFPGDRKTFKRFRRVNVAESDVV